MRAIFLGLCTAFVLLAMPARAQCVGQNLLETMPPADLAALQEAAAAAPFSTGNFWRATKGDQVVHLIGTYHMDDPRHSDTTAIIAPVLASVSQLMVEAGPQEMAALKKRVASDPSIMINTKGPTFPEVLPPEVWETLKTAMAARGVPAFMVAKMQPWYLSMLLSIPACALSEMGGGKGLDGALIDMARAQNLPISALEPYDTVFAVFDAMLPKDQMAMVTQALAMDGQAEDLSVTLADGYFAEQSQLIWQLMRAETLKMPGTTLAEAEAEFAAMEEGMVHARNRAWIPVIEAAAEKGPLLVAFGALHLPGDQGVLQLLQAQGYHIERMDFR